MPAEWKQEFLTDIVKDAKGFDFAELDDLDPETLKLAMILIIEAISEDAPWFAQVVTPEKQGWLLNELSMVRKDVQCLREQLRKRTS
jgi:hypothetical protein